MSVLFPSVKVVFTIGYHFYFEEVEDMVVQIDLACRK
jgi:hypothetical protein